MDEDILRSKKDDRLLKAIDFRNRNVFSDADRFLRKVEGDELLRLDFMAKKLFSDETFVEYLVDANEKDILSFAQAEVMAFPNPALVGA